MYRYLWRCLMLGYEASNAHNAVYIILVIYYKGVGYASRNGNNVNIK